MKSFSSWLLLFFTVLFWIFRVVVAFTDTMGFDFFVKPLNMNFEVILLFVVFFCIILVAKRKLIGGLIFFLSYAAYFGMDVYTILSEAETITLETFTPALISIIAVLLSLFTLFDLIINKNRADRVTDKKTDWFYKNEQFDREMDERADKNQYRIN